MTLTQKLVRDLFTYDEMTGSLVWKVKPAKQISIGTIAGTSRPDGYTQVKIQGKFYMVHRVIWLLSFNVWPDGDIDHINGNRSDNRLNNLRLVTRKQNLENQKLQASNKSGFRGVSWSNQKKKWRVQINHHGKQYTIGLFNDLLEAAAAAKAGRDLLFTHHHTEYSA